MSIADLPKPRTTRQLEEVLVQNLGFIEYIGSKYLPAIMTTWDTFALDKEDIQQEIFLEIIESIGEYDMNKSGFQTYLTNRIASRLTSFLRRASALSRGGTGIQNRWRGEAVKLIRLDETIQGRSEICLKDTISTQHDEYEDFLLLHELVRELTQKEKKILAYLLHGYSLKEIAKKENIHVNTVKYRRKRIREKWNKL